jgi:hypothetical protein
MKEDAGNAGLGREVDSALRPRSCLDPVEPGRFRRRNLDGRLNTGETVGLIGPDIGEQALAVALIRYVERFEIASLPPSDSQVHIWGRRTLPLGSDHCPSILSASIRRSEAVPVPIEN